MISYRVRVYRCGRRHCRDSAGVGDVDVNGLRICVVSGRVHQLVAVIRGCGRMRRDIVSGCRSVGVVGHQVGI